MLQNLEMSETHLTPGHQTKGLSRVSPMASPQALNHSQQLPEECSPNLKRDQLAKASFSTPKSSSKLALPRKRPFQSPNTAHSTTSRKSPKLSHGPTQTPTSDSSRTGWAPLLVKLNNKIQVKIMVRKANGKKGPFTSAGPNSKLRPAWDSILNCEYEKTSKPGGGLKCEFLCTSSENDRHRFRADLIDPFMNSKDSLMQKTSELVLNNPKLLGLYLSLLSRSKDFFNHSEKYDENGFMKDKSGITIDHLSEAGGTLQELEAFLQLGRENFVDLGEAGCEDAKMRSRKITDFFNPKLTTKKMSKQEIVEKNFREVISSEEGLEKSLTTQYVDYTMIPISRLQKSPELFVKINQSKVDDLAASMYERYDPTAAVLMVCPKDYDQFDLNGEADVYYVVHGSHRWAAMKLLEQRGLLSKLPGMVDKKVACFVIKKATAVVTNYCNLRSNDLAAEYQSNPRIYQIIFVYLGLLKCSKDPYQSQNDITKICHSRRVHQDDIAAIQKICQWSESGLNKLSAVLEKYQNYTTSDVAAKGDRTALRRRESKKMTQSMFRALGRVGEDMFEENYEKVLSNDMSLKSLVDQNESHLLLQKTERNAVLAAGVGSAEELRTKYPQRFEPNTLRNYLGAEVYGKKANMQGDNLRSYVKSVKSGTEYQCPVKLDSCENILEIGSEFINRFDIVIFEASSVPEDYLSFVINNVGSSFTPTDENRAILLLLSCQDDLLKVLNTLECWRNKPGFSVYLCSFEKEKGKVDEKKLKENASYCVLFGKVNVHTGNLKSVSKPIESELPRIVAQISKPSAKIAYISLGNGEVMKLHRMEDNRLVNYIVNKNMKEKLTKKFLVGVLSQEVASKTSMLEKFGASSGVANDDVEESSDEENSSQDEDIDDDVGEEEEEEEEIDDHNYGEASYEDQAEIDKNPKKDGLERSDSTSSK